MDPNSALENILSLVEAIRDASNRDDTADRAVYGEELAEAVSDLNDWLVKGGFIPTDWYS